MINVSVALHEMQEMMKEMSGTAEFNTMSEAEMKKEVGRLAKKIEGPQRAVDQT